MSVKPFLDTNVLVYAFTANDPRNKRAEDMLADGGIVSVQVLNEFVNALRNKQGRDWDEIIEALEVIDALLEPPLPLSKAIHENAVEISRARHFHFYDSLIVAGALAAGCNILYTEDLKHDQKIEGLTVRNPFLAA